MAVSKKTARIIAAGLFVLTLLFALAPTALAAVYWGQSGETVRRVQQKLKQWGYYTGAVDGVFGQSTYDAVIQFQKKNGLTADGVAGAATLAAMGISETTAASAVTTAASGYASEVELLARLIHGEARGEPYVGMVAVGAVVLNRVKSSRFPNTMAGVIYQSGAFDAVSDGQINLAPSEQSRRAARDAMNGWDPTGAETVFAAFSLASTPLLLADTVAIFADCGLASMINPAVCTSSFQFCINSFAVSPLPLV